VFAGNFQFTDEQFFTQFNRSEVAQDSYELLNASIAWRSSNEVWQVRLYGENLTDEEYFTNSLESGVPAPGTDPVVPQYFVGAPRTYGLKAQFNFGGE
jgi:iron complex outermembrane receptor protein